MTELYAYAFTTETTGIEDEVGDGSDALVEVEDVEDAGTPASSPPGCDPLANTPSTTWITPFFVR